MHRFRNSVLCLALVPALGCAAVDPALLNLAMPDSKVLAGAQVERVKNSPFGRFVLSHLQFDDPDFQKFLAATGFDPLRDIAEILVAANISDSGTPRWLVLAKGSFDVARIQGAAQSAGGKVSHRGGATIISGKDPATVICFLDSTVAAMGSMEMVEGTVDRRRGGGGSSLAAKAQQTSAGNAFWFTSLMPLSLFAAAVPDSNLSAALKGSLLQSIQQASGGIKFGANVQLSLEAVTKTPADAAALVDVLKFIANMVQTNRQNDKTAARASTLLDALQISVQGNVMNMTLAVPETTLEQMFDGIRSSHGGAQAPNHPR